MAVAIRADMHWPFFVASVKAHLVLADWTHNYFLILVDYHLPPHKRELL